MLKVIVNSTPIIAFSKIGKLDLLRQMYVEVTIPRAVFREVTAKNDSAGRNIVKNRWINIEAVANIGDQRMYSAKLHAGEVEVMILAQRTEDHLVVIDDRAARKTAEFLGLNLTGTVGILIKAKQRGFIPKVMPLVASMEASEIFLSEGLKQQIRKLCGE